MARLTTLAALLLVIATLAGLAAPPPAVAFNPVKPICTLAGLVSTLAGKVCSATGHAGRLLSAGKKLLGGHLGGALGSLLGDGGTTVAKKVATVAGIAAIGAWVAAGARNALHATASVISSTTRPRLRSTWFSASYWRMAAVSALLTLPFLFAAAIQALLRSDLTLLVRAAFGYLPLGLLAVGIAAPLAMLLLAASDEMSAIVSSASGNAGSNFLAHAGQLAAGAGALAGSPFLVFVVALLTAAATLTLWIELLIRSAAVYVVVLMLPLFFAAMVWPARRVWAIRAVELLVALILSKFAIVAVLALGGAALGHSTIPSATEMLAGATLVLLAAFSPWALLRLLPLHELAGAAAGLRGAPMARLSVATAGAGRAGAAAHELAWELPARLRRQSQSDPALQAARTATQRLEAGEGDWPPAALPGLVGASAGAAGPPGGAPSPGTGPATTVDGAPSSGAGPGTTGGWAGAASAGPGPGGTGPGAASPGAADPPPLERLPGMPARWQMSDGSWPELVLGPPDGPPPDSGDGRTPPSAADGPAARPGEDPLPPRQEPEGGPL